MSFLRVLAAGSFDFLGMAFSAAVGDGGVTAGSTVSNPSVFLVKMFVAMNLLSL
jgi:hypothetical protein